MTVWTIGHSTRTLEEFIELLQRERIESLADVRAFPMSRRYPHFNRESLSVALPAVGIRYEHVPQLGGRRSLPKDAPPSAWRNSGFKAYAAYMLTPQFRAAIDELRATGESRRTAVTCAEAVPWRCHRNLISDALVARGDAVLHIMDGATTPHVLTRFAIVRGDVVTYPTSETSEQLALLDDPG